MANITSGKIQFNAKTAKDFRATMAIWHIFDFECKDYAKKYSNIIKGYKDIIARNTESIEKKNFGTHDEAWFVADSADMAKRIEDARNEFAAWKEQQAESVQKSEKIFSKTLYKSYVASLSESDNAWRSSAYTEDLATLLESNGLVPTWDTLDELYHAVSFRASTGSVSAKTGKHTMALTESAWRKVLMGRLCDLMGDTLPTYKFQHIIAKKAKKSAK